jgi:hypothetical protein
MVTMPPAGTAALRVFAAAALWTAGAVVILLFASVPVDASRISDAMTEARIRVGCETWDLAEPRDFSQWLTVLSGEFAWDSGLGATVELAGQHSTGPCAELPLDRGLSGALLLHYGPVAGMWTAQAGVSTPSTAGHLSAEQRGLVRMLGEPVLGFADPDPVRGWRFHLGTVVGIPVRRGVELAGGIGCEIAAAFEPAEGARLDPADRVFALVSIEREGEHSVGRIRVSLSLEGSEKVGAALVRKNRRVGGIEAAARWRLRSVWIGASAALAAANRVTLADPDEYAIWAESGPGRMAQLAFSIAPARGHGCWGSRMLGPSLDIAYRRFMPSGLPFGDGWSLGLFPRVGFSRGGRELAFFLGWSTGRWKTFDPQIPGERESIQGWKAGLEYGWRAKHATGAEER